LVSNAVKFTEKGGVGVEIDRFGGHLKIAVSDSGVGIPLDRRDAVFEAFSQAEASTTRRFGGTGLGLTIVRELVSLMGGSITVDSAEGVGSVFTVLVPMARVSRRKRPKPLAARQAATTRDGLKVLIAEDNEINRLVLTTLIGQLGASTVVTENGRQAVDAWASGGFDLVLMDVQMPVLDGLSATREIRSREAAAGRRRTPVIALTGDVMPHHLLEYEQHGMDACVAKPIIVGDLVDVLDRVLAESGAAESAA
jgi:CheY-like chemotaxis protein